MDSIWFSQHFHFVGENIATDSGSKHGLEFNHHTQTTLDRTRLADEPHDHRIADHGSVVYRLNAKCSERSAQFLTDSWHGLD